MNKIVKASFLLTVFVALTLLPYAVCWEVGPGWTFANTQTTPTPTPTATAVLSAGTGCLVGGTWDTDNLQVYINGLASGSSVAQSLNPTTNAYDFTVGKDPASTNFRYTGTVSYVLVLDHAATAQEMYLISIGVLTP